MHACFCARSALAALLLVFFCLFFSPSFFANVGFKGCRVGCSPYTSSPFQKVFEEWGSKTAYEGLLVQGGTSQVVGFTV